MNKFYSQLTHAFNDIKESVLRSRLWLHLGWSDIQLRYRGSILGPLWITFSMVIFIIALSIVYSRLFHIEIKILIPFLTTGLLCWSFISTVVLESSDVFVNAKPFIDNAKLPFVMYMFRLIWRNHIIFFHNFAVFIVVACIFQIGISINGLFFIPAFILVSILLTCIGVLLGLLGARFRDIPPVISSFIMVVFFVSPVTWNPDMLGKNSLIIKLNPIYYILDLLRSPLLGTAPNLDSWLACLFMLGVFFIVSGVVFSKYRSRIPFWI